MLKIETSKLLELCNATGTDPYEAMQFVYSSYSRKKFDAAMEAGVFSFQSEKQVASLCYYFSRKLHMGEKSLDQYFFDWYGLEKLFKESDEEIFDYHYRWLSDDNKKIIQTIAEFMFNNERNQISLKDNS